MSSFQGLWLFASFALASSSTALLTSADCPVVAGGSQGSGNHQLHHPTGVAVDASENIYVADLDNHRIMRFTEGTAAGTQVAGDGTSGTSLAKLQRPMKVELTSGGNLLIAENADLNRVSEWTPETSPGTLRATFAGRPVAIAETSSGDLFVTSQFGSYAGRFPSGSTTGEDWSGRSGLTPRGVDVDSAGRVYIAAGDGNGVWRFPATKDLSGGEKVALSGGIGSGLNQARDTRELKLDSRGHMWILDDGNDRVLVCIEGESECHLVIDGLASPYGIAFNSAETHFYVAELTAHQVRKCPVPVYYTTTTSSTSTVTTSSTSTSSHTVTSSSTTTTSSSSTTTTRTISSTSTTTSSATTTSTSSTTSSATTSTTTTTTSSTTTSSTTTTSNSVTTSSTSTTTISATSSSTSTSTSSSSATTSATTTSTSSATSSSTSTTSSSATTTSTSSATTTSATSSATTSATNSATTTRTRTTSMSAATQTTTATTTMPTRTTISSATTTSTSTGTGSTTTTRSHTTTTNTASTSTTTTTSSSTVTTSVHRAPAAATSAPATEESSTSAAPSEVAAGLLDAVSAATSVLFDQLQGGVDQATASLPQGAGTLTAVRLGGKDSLANSSGDGITVSVTTGGNGAMDITLPSAVFADLDASSVAGDSLSLVVASFSSAKSSSLGGQREDREGSGVVELQVISAITIDLTYILSGESPPVGELVEPIVFPMPAVNYTPGMRCAYWAEEDQGWSFQGVETPKEGNAEGQPLVCHTYHLSFFAAILEAFISTLQCAQFGLMTPAAIRNLFEESAWLDTQSAWICGAIFGSFLLAMGLAAVLDCRRARAHRWRDEFFLVATATGQEDLAGVVERQEQTAGEAEADEEEAEQEPSLLAKVLAGGLLVTSTCLQCLNESSAFREALDEILSNWFEYWGQLRGACEALCEVVAEGSGATAAALSHRAATIFLMASSRRMVASSLGLSNDAVTFVLEDEDLRDFLTDGHGHSDAVGTRAHDWRTTEDQRMAWTSLHDSVVHHVLEHSGRHTLCGLPRIIRDFFISHNPVGALFVVDIFHSCKRRVLLLGMDLFGTLALSCVFFDATGLVRGKPVGDGDNCGGDDSWAGRIGRFLAIATGALLVSSVPVAIIDSFQTKGFRKLDYPGSKAWKKQLRIWVIQDRIVWTLGILYIAFCAFFVLVFLASIGPEDHEDWSSAGLFALGEEFAVMPAFLAFVVPTATAAFLHLHSKVHRTDRQTTLRRSQTTLLQESNLMLPITQI